MGSLRSWQGIYLIGCTVSVECDAHLIVALVLAGQSDASSQRNLNNSEQRKKYFNGALKIKLKKANHVFTCAPTMPLPP